MTSQLQSWYKIWYAPKEVASYMTQHSNKLSIFFLLLIYGFSSQILIKAPYIQESIMLYGINARLVTSLIIGAIIAGAITALIYSIFLYSVSSIFNKDVVFGNGFIIYAWSLAPFILFVLSFFTFKLPLESLLPLFLLFTFYSSILLLFKISEINHISLGKSIIILMILWAIQFASSYFFGIRLF